MEEVKRPAKIKLKELIGKHEDELKTTKSLLKKFCFGQELNLSSLTNYIADETIELKDWRYLRETPKKSVSDSVGEKKKRTHDGTNKAR